MSDNANENGPSDLGYTYLNIPYIPDDESYVSFSLRLDKAIYYNTPEPDPPAHLIAKLIFRGTVIPPVMLEYSSSQRFELLLIDSSGIEVYRWSKGRIFRMIRSIGPRVGEEIRKVEVVLADSNGKSLPEGRYIAKANLTTSVDGTVPQDIPGKYSATVGFLISNQIPPYDPKI